MEFIVYMKSNQANYNAKGIYKNGKLIVLKGSKIREKNSKEYNRIRQAIEYRENAEYVDKKMIVKKDIIFDSPSTAAQFVADTSRNGLIYWRNENNVKLRDLIK